MRVIIPRECPDPRTDHCIGLPPKFPETGPTRCDFCGRFMPLDEVIDFDGEYAESRIFRGKKRTA